MPDDETLGGFSLIDSWRQLVVSDPGGGASYGDMIAALRDFLDRIAAARPDGATTAALGEDLSNWSRRLALLAVTEREQLFGHRHDLANRGQTMTPAFVVDHGDAHSVRGHVTYGRYYLGINGAVHGGAIPLLFDEVLSWLANAGGRAISRTAYLRTDFRAITPIEVRLDVHAWYVSEEGRKRLLRAELRHGETLCAESEGLFVALKPGQP